jgi:hypothetical protein
MVATVLFQIPFFISSINSRNKKVLLYLLSKALGVYHKATHDTKYFVDVTKDSDMSPTTTMTNDMYIDRQYVVYYDKASTNQTVKG